MDYPNVLAAAGFLFVMIFLAKSVHRVSEDQRLVVFRLGKHYSTKEPGLAFVFPFIDFPVSVDLKVCLPNWRSLDECEIRKSAENIAKNISKNSKHT